MQFQLVLEKANIATETSKLLAKLKESALGGEDVVVPPVNTQDVLDG